MDTEPYGLKEGSGPCIGSLGLFAIKDSWSGGCSFVINVIILLASVPPTCFSGQTGIIFSMRLTREFSLAV